MSQVAYTVWAEFDDPETRLRFREWLQLEHIGQVIDAGAVEADLLEHEPSAEVPGGAVEVRYLFASREALGEYLEHRMPALRAETVRHFGATPGIRYHRVDAVVVDRFGIRRV